MKNKYKFFLGGKDAEMQRIAEVLKTNGVPFEDAELGWGAKASSYGSLLDGASVRGFTIVLVELEADSGLYDGLIEIDHHGDRSAEQASILQVLNLLGIEPTRLDLLIAANDSGYIPAMLAIGATLEEIEAVRALDRSAQGITPEQEDEAEQALAAAEAYEVAATGELVVVQLPHSKCGTVTDRLFSHWKGGRENLLVLSGDGEANFFGDGALCAALKEKFKGWNGGSGLGVKGQAAFWGGYPNHEQVLAFIRDHQN